MKITIKTLAKNNHNILSQLGRITTGLYNSANYQRIQEWKKTGKIPNYYQQTFEFKNNPLARLLHSQVAQQTLKELDRAYKSWFSLRKRDKEARPPRFRKKNTPVSIWFTPTSFKIIDDNTFRISTENLNINQKFTYIKIIPNEKYDLTKMKVKMINVVFKENKIYACFCCEIQEEKEFNETNIKAIDLGINNLIASTDVNGKQEIISGREIKSIQRYFNKKTSELRSKLKNNKSSETIRKLHQKKSRQIKHRLHIVTKYIAEKAKEEQCAIIIGDLTNIRKSKRKKKVINKDGIEIKKRVLRVKEAQKINEWGFDTFTSLLEYKCKRLGVKVIKESERYTSRTCPSCGIVKRSNRKTRGFYKCKCGYKCNADINGAKNILLRYLGQKVSPVSYDIGVVVNGTDRSILNFHNNDSLICRESTLF
jgi:putative transposase